MVVSARKNSGKENSPRCQQEHLPLVADLASSGVDVSRNTDVRAPRCSGLQGHRPRRTPLLKERHITARLRFAREHLKGKDEFWKSALWSDETKLELFGHMDVAYV